MEPTMPKGIPLTHEELDRRRHDIFAASVNLFLEKGFRETSMREIADVSKMGKSTLYDYFKTKDEILLWGVEDELFDLTTAAKEIVRQPLPAILRLRQVMEKHLEFLLERKEFYLKLSFEVQRLAMESQKRIQAGRHAYQDMIRQLIEEGIQEGSFRPVDSLLAARTLITVLTPTVFTSRPTGTPEEMLNSAFDIILKGIQT
jgi:TetR/AcrR family transcriptional regulator, cholesterol catabolism regulator